MKDLDKKVLEAIDACKTTEEKKSFMRGALLQAQQVAAYFNTLADHHGREKAIPLFLLCREFDTAAVLEEAKAEELFKLWDNEDASPNEDDPTFN